MHWFWLGGLGRALAGWREEFSLGGWGRLHCELSWGEKGRSREGEEQGSPKQGDKENMAGWASSSMSHKGADVLECCRELVAGPPERSCMDLAKSERGSWKFSAVWRFPLSPNLCGNPRQHWEQCQGESTRRWILGFLWECGSSGCGLVVFIHCYEHWIGAQPIIPMRAFYGEEVSVPREVETNLNWQLESESSA